MVRDLGAPPPHQKQEGTLALSPWYCAGGPRQSNKARKGNRRHTEERKEERKQHVLVKDMMALGYENSKETYTYLLELPSVSSGAAGYKMDTQTRAPFSVPATNP